MFDEAQVKLIIEAATDAARKKMQEFTDTAEQGLKDADKSARSFGDGLKAGWAKAKAAWVEITAAILAVRKAYGMMNQAAQFKERETAFANMAASHGADADRIIADMKRISRNTIDTMTIMEKAGTAMTLGIQADKLDDLMEVARASSKITGQTVSEAFSDITLAVGRQSKMILDNLGIIVKVEDANERYAAKLGKVSDELTEAEKKQAFLNATLEAGKDIVERVGDVQDSAAERIQRYEARWTNAGIVIGKVFLNVAQAIEFAFTTVGVAVNTIIEKTAKSVGWLAEKLVAVLPGDGGGWADIAKWAKEIGENSEKAADEGVAHMSETWDAMTALWEKSQPTVRAAATGLEEVKQSAKDTGDEIKAIIDLQQSEAETRAAAIEEMYEEMGLNAEGHYREEINQLIEKVKNWQDAGASIEDTNKYLYEKINALEEEALEKGADAQANWLSVLKWHTQELVDDLREKEIQMQAEFAEITAGIETLDGSQIGIHVKLYDDGFTSGMENILSKISQLQSAASSVSGTTGSSGSISFDLNDGLAVEELEAQVAQNIKYGQSALTDML